MDYTFSSNLKSLRKKCGLSQKDLSSKVNVSQQTISAWEKDERYPTVDKVYDLACVFSVPIESLLCENSLQQTK